MSDDRRNRPRTGLDEVRDGGLDDLLRALEEERAGEVRAPRGVDRPLPGSDGEAGVPPRRRDVELLGLLAWGLGQRPPVPEVKDRLVSAVRAEAAAAAGSAPPRSSDVRSSATAAGPVVSLVAARVDRDGAAGSPSVPAAPARSGRPFRPPAWLTTLAASLLLAVVGLALFSGWLYSRIDEQQATIARLSRQLEATTGEAERLAAARADLERSRLHLASRLSLVATPGTEVCPLRPVGRQPVAPDARGLLFLSGPRDEWYVRVANVEPAPEGRAYRLWFRLGDEFRPAGILLPGIDGGVELAGSRLPPEDRMTAALVTLEPAARTPARPTGPTVLYGDEKMDMI